jgi:hypothetical protein
MSTSRTINIIAKQSKSYDLDKIAESNTRSDSSKPFVAHIKLYNPLSKNSIIKSVVPEGIKIGAI